MFKPNYIVFLMILGSGSSISMADDERINSAYIDLPEAISEYDLNATRGLGGSADFLQLNDMNLDADLSDNVVHSSFNGDNTISNGAFSEASGFATVIQNSGNHVIIQNATIVNLTME